MIYLSILLLAGPFLGGVLATPTLGHHSELDKRQTVVRQGEGIGRDGFFYSVWDDGNMQQTFTDRADGAYDLSWSGNGDVVAGKGWQEGSGRNITYSANYATGGMSFLMIYGWFEKPLVEYYVMENWDDTSDPSKDTDMQYITTLNSDGSDYDVFKKVQVNWPSILGRATFDQYRSVRKAGRRTSGTVNMANHFNAWRGAGVTLNEGHYQIVAIEGMQAGSDGSASVKVERENSAPATAPGPAAAPPPPPPPPPMPAPAPSSSSIQPQPPPPPPSSSVQPPPPPPPSSSALPPVPESTAAPPPPTTEAAPILPLPPQTQPATTAVPPPSVPPPGSSSSSATSTRGRAWRYGNRKGRKSSTTAAPAPTPQDSVPAPSATTETEVAYITTVEYVTVFHTVAA